MRPDQSPWLESPLTTSVRAEALGPAFALADLPGRNRSPVSRVIPNIGKCFAELEPSLPDAPAFPFAGALECRRASPRRLAPGRDKTAAVSATAMTRIRVR